MVVTSTLKKLVLVSLVLSFSTSCIHADTLKACKFDKIYNLGDSLSDTGNLIREFPIGALSTFARLPYGETFFNKPTGRCSNGLLMIDYIAMDAGIPFLPPYRDSDANFTHGVNFAVAGSTALPWGTLATHFILSPLTFSSLSVQLDWMSFHFNSICHNHTDCGEKLQNALFMVGEIGGNDFNYAILEGIKTMEELRSLVPKIVDAMMAAVKTVISFGATRVVVPGNFPIGCLPAYRTYFEANILIAYDENQCLKELNDFAKYYNEQLQQAIDKLKQESLNATIVYGDYYNAYLFLLQYSKSHGIDTQRACCGIGGKYNFKLTRACGFPYVPVCTDPDRYMSWDGLHLTQEAYKIITAWLVQDIFPKLHCQS